MGTKCAHEQLRKHEDEGNRTHNCMWVVRSESELGHADKTHGERCSKKAEKSAAQNHQRMHNKPSLPCGLTADLAVPAALEVAGHHGGNGDEEQPREDHEHSMRAQQRLSSAPSDNDNDNCPTPFSPCAA